MEDLGCVFGCVEGFFFLSQTLAGRVYNIFFLLYFQKNRCEFFVTFTVWEMGLYKKECKLVLRCPFYALAEQSQKARGRFKEKRHFFLHLKILPRLAKILFCLEMPVRWQLLFLFVCFSTQLLVCSAFN